MGVPCIDVLTLSLVSRSAKNIPLKESQKGLLFPWWGTEQWAVTEPRLFMNTTLTSLFTVGPNVNIKI